MLGNKIIVSGLTAAPPRCKEVIVTVSTMFRPSKSEPQKGFTPAVTMFTPAVTMVELALVSLFQASGEHVAWALAAASLSSP